MKKRILFWLGVWSGKPILNFLYNTNRWNVQGSEHYEAALESGRSVIVACWHSCLLIPFMHLSGNQYHGVTGTHGDAEIITRIGEKLGWNILRGSSTERGREAYDNMLRILQERENLVAITPDGPKGPAKIPKAGAVRAAQRTGVVIVPAAGQSTRRWSFTNWDTFYVAKPFGQIEIVYGEPLSFNEDDDFDNCVNRLKYALDRLEAEVDARAKG